MNLAVALVLIFILKSIVFWDVTPCILVDVAELLPDCTASRRCHCENSKRNIFAPSLIMYTLINR
jgi:hypothetical protein